MSDSQPNNIDVQTWLSQVAAARQLLADAKTALAAAQAQLAYAQTQWNDLQAKAQQQFNQLIGNTP